MRLAIGLTIGFIVLMIGSCGEDKKPSPMKQNDAKSLYTTHCGLCHGDDGRKGLAGAKAIPDSQMEVQERVAIITQGRGNMVPFRGVITPEEIKAIAEYTLTLK